jgi:hypothetical protein
MATIKVRRGLRANLPSTGQPGEIFFCYDTGEVFIANNQGNLVLINSYESEIAERIWDSQKENNYGLDTLKVLSLSTNFILRNGTISFSTNKEISWSILKIATNGRGNHFSTSGYFLIEMPNFQDDINYFNRDPIAVSNNGIPIKYYTNSQDPALYYLLPLGSSYETQLSNFIIYDRNGNGSDYVIPVNAVKLFQYDDSTNKLILWNGVELSPGSSW